MAVDDFRLKKKPLIGNWRSPQVLVRWFGIVLSITLLFWILHSFDLAGVGRALQAAKYLFLVPVAMILVIDMIVRSFRWGILFNEGKKVGRSSLFIAYMIGNFFNNILPARSGDLIRAYILGQREEIPKTTAFATIIVERIADLLVILLLIPIILIFFPVSEWLSRAGIGFAITGFAGLIFLFIINQWGMGFAKRILDLFTFLPESIRDKSRMLADNFLIGISGMRSKRKIAFFISFTAFIWVLEVSLVWLIAKMFSLPLTFGGALFVLLSIALGMAIPASPGSLGTYEIFATNALMLLGMGGSNILGFALLMHAITFLGASFIGVICMIWNGRKLGFPEATENKAYADDSFS